MYESGTPCVCRVRLSVCELDPTCPVGGFVLQHERWGPEGVAGVQMIGQSATTNTLGLLLLSCQHAQIWEQSLPNHFATNP